MHQPTTTAPLTAGAKPDASTLEALLRPRSVAVIGASRDPGTVSGAIFSNLLRQNFRGAVYPVNPKAPVVQSIAAYSSIADVPGEVDLAVIVVPSTQVLAAVEACGIKGVRAVVVITAGFREVGSEGAELERQVLAAVRRHGMRMVGPNCLGVINTEADVRLNAQFAPIHPPAGSVAFSSQSGALGVAILEYASSLNIGISHFVSVGNKADVSGNDLLEFWEHDAGTRLILLYLESFGNPRRFIEIARRVGREKPILAVKSGRTRAGMRAAASHTGAIAGGDAAVQALCRQSGVIRCDTMEEMFDVAMVLANQPVPRGRRVGIVTNSGGPGILATDACESHGLEVPVLSDATLERLRGWLPPEASVRNPVDMIASASPETFEKAVGAVLGDPNIDSLLVLYVPPITTNAPEVAERIVRGVAEATRLADLEGRPHKPVLSCFLGTHGLQQSMSTLHEGDIPSYVFPESAAIALARAVGYGEWRRQEPGVPRRFAVDTERARRALESAAKRGPRAWLAPHEIAEVMAAYGLPQPASPLVTTEDRAVEAARALGYPVVLKLHSSTLTHKTDVGGVALDLRGDAEVREAWRRIRRSLEQRGQLDQMEGATLQPMLREGVETILGMTRDPGFGPLIMFGLGGVTVEIMKDVSFRIAPLTDRDAREIMREVRAYPLLEGYRGAPPCDVPALHEALLRLSQLAEDLPQIAEMDLNPVRVLAPGRGVVAVDARVRLEG